MIDLDTLNSGVAFDVTGTLDMMGYLMFALYIVGFMLIVARKTRKRARSQAVVAS